MRDDVHFTDAAARFGDEPGDLYVGEAADFPFDFGEVEFVHAFLRVHRRVPFPTH